MIYEWKRLTGEGIHDLSDTLLTDIANSPTDNLKFYVGCDSLWDKGQLTFTTAIIMVKENKGGRVYYKRFVLPFGELSLSQRLFLETFRAVKVAIWLNPLLETIGYKVDEIHADLNPNSNYASSVMVQTCLGYIRGMGFKGQVKPNSWAASSVADYKTR